MKSLKIYNLIIFGINGIWTAVVSAEILAVMVSTTLVICDKKNMDICRNKYGVSYDLL